MQTVKIEPHYKISIPKKARESLGLKIGDEVKITLRPAKAQTTYTPTARERRAIEKGREEIRKGNSYTLNEFRDWLLGSPRKEAGAKKSQARAKTRA